MGESHAIRQPPWLISDGFLSDAPFLLLVIKKNPSTPNGPNKINKPHRFFEAFFMSAIFVFFLHLASTPILRDTSTAFFQMQNFWPVNKTSLYMSCPRWKNRISPSHHAIPRSNTFYLMAGRAKNLRRKTG